MAIPKQRVIPSEPVSPPLAQSKKVIPSSGETVDANVDVQSAPQVTATAQLPDPLQAVDYISKPIKIGDIVDIYSCKVVGLRPDSNNHLNVLVVPLFNNITSSDKSNPLIGQVDGKAILISGYHCTVIVSAKEAGASRAAAIDAGLALKAERDANPPSTKALPTNFLAPSFV